MDNCKEEVGNAAENGNSDKLNLELNTINAKGKKKLEVTENLDLELSKLRKKLKL